MRQLERWLPGCIAAVLLVPAAAELISACGSKGSTSGSFAENGSGNGDDSGPSNGSSSGGSSSGVTGTASGGSQNNGGGSSSSSGGNAGTSGGGSGQDAGSGTPPTSTAFCLQAGSGDYSKAGPYAVSTMSVDLATTGEVDAGPTTATIFYPTTLEANCPHPIAAWGNGTGVTGSTVYGFFNNNVASWGIVVIASDNSNVAAQPYLQAGIDYLLAQNKVSSSVFYGKLGTKAGVAGHSQGGFAATTATQQANVVSEVCVEGGGVPKQGVSTLCLTGNQSTSVNAINAVNADVIQMTYPGTTGPGFLADWDGGDHLTTPTESGWIMQDPGTIQFVRLMTAWYRCFLASDNAACALFKGGSSCGICKDPGWAQLESKNL
ncbi:MAG: hypothetical protein ACLP1X_07690 [Polyangiaceae bacterium]|jgi:hypothetical protein